jgi:hypothetical protein
MPFGGILPPSKPSFDLQGEIEVGILVWKVQNAGIC